MPVRILPHDIWTAVADYLPDEVLFGLRTLNRTLRDVAEASIYRCLTIDNWNQKTECKLQGIMQVVCFFFFDSYLIAVVMPMLADSLGRSDYTPEKSRSRKSPPLQRAPNDSALVVGIAMTQSSRRRKSMCVCSQIPFAPCHKS